MRLYDRQTRHVAVDWLNADFIVLATGTPDANRSDDLLGLVKLIQAPQAARDAAKAKLNSGAGFTPFNGTAGDTGTRRKLLRASTEYVEKYIINDEMRKDPLTQGVRLSDLQQAIMLKRTFASSVDGRRIGADIPALTARNFKIEYTDEERTKYIGVAKEPNSKLIKLDRQTGKVVWNLAAVRKLVLFALSPIFVVLEEELTAKKCAALLNKAAGEKANNEMWLVNWLLRKHDKKTGTGFAGLDKDAKLAVLLGDSPKMRAMIRMLKDKVFLHQAKELLYATIPAQMVFIFAILKALWFSVGCFHSKLDSAQRNQLVQSFNQSDDPMILLTTPVLAGVGLNLQHCCHNVLFVDPPMSRGLFRQAVCRMHRIKQKHMVEVGVLVSAGTFNEKQISNNLRKALPGAISSLDIAKFDGGDLSEDEFGEVQIELGAWAKLPNGTLVRSTDPQAQGLPVISGLEVLKEILALEGGMEVRLAVEDVDNE